MSARAEMLAARRTRLLTRSERLRGEFGAAATAMSQRFRVADRFIAASRSGPVRMLFASAAALLFFGRTRRVLHLASKLAIWYPLLGPLLRRLWESRVSRPL
jgi:hypothetical protein